MISPRRSRPHGPDQPLIVTLTSFPACFATLGLTLRALLMQSVRPDAVMLWLTAEDKALLPADVTALIPHGLEIDTCPDLRSYKKIIPAIEAFPDALFATADDDLYFEPDWLQNMLTLRSPGRIPCHRAHQITRTADGGPASYRSWTQNAKDAIWGPLVFPTSGAGALYSRAALHEDVCRRDLFTELAPRTDDVWLYWMMRLAGQEAHKTVKPFELIEWPDSQRESLKSGNLYGPGNDEAVAALTARYGFPG